MKRVFPVIPVVLFAYARPQHLLQTLESLKINQPPEIIAFSDGPRTPDKEPLVKEVRQILHSINWCKITIYEKEKNVGLGPSILSGVNFVLETNPAIIVFEDDIVSAPGTYEFLAESLRRYWFEPRVMSVTGWTHPIVTPHGIGENPYFDGRAECWSWGTWKRAWYGMDIDAWTLMKNCKRKGININKYGYDLPKTAKLEKKKKIWAIRFLFNHIDKGGLCLRPPFSLVENVGFDSMATNTKDSGQWQSFGIKELNLTKIEWPEIIENVECEDLWRAAYPYISLSKRVSRKLASIFNRLIAVKPV
jgi:hypothetical protein